MSDKRYFVFELKLMDKGTPDERMSVIDIKEYPSENFAHGAIGKGDNKQVVVMQDVLGMTTWDFNEEES